MDTNAANVERFSGFADLYDKYRPAPPQVLATVLCGIARTDRPGCVVDLGSGTGLSTRYWSGKAQAVIGIEPSNDMRAQAAQQTPADSNVSYREGLSHLTGLPDRCARIVTCAQSLHWMEPQPTFDEAARILEPGGVFAAFDYDWPPVTGVWEADSAYEQCMSRVREREKTASSTRSVRYWDKAGHLARMQASGRFRHAREFLLHHCDTGNAGRFIGLMLSQGGVMSLLKEGIAESELGLDEFREVAKRVLGKQERAWYWSLRVRIGVV